MRIVSNGELNKILEQHLAWVRSEGNKGACAHLKGAILKDANLKDACLRGADLRYADLRDANLSGANLSGANLKGVDLRDAILRGANLKNAILKYADLRDADLSDAILIHTGLSGTNLEGAKIFIPIACSEEGSFIGYKKCGKYIVKLRITETSKRCSSTSRKCRCSEAEVLSITNLDGTPNYITSVSSDYDPNFVYKVGEIVSVSDFDENRWNECSTGIHFFITREEAVKYNMV